MQPAPVTIPAPPQPAHDKEKKNEWIPAPNPPLEQQITWTLMNQLSTSSETEDQETKQSSNNSGTKPKWRRPRTRKNKEITIASINVRGLKGKIRSLESLLKTENIEITLITETMLKKGDQISIKGYRWTERPRPNNKGGGVGILIAEKIANITSDDNKCEEHEQLETKWIRLESRPKNIAIGVFYGPQENEKIEKVQEIYTALNNQINQQTEDNEVIFAGDFNAKLKVNREDCVQTISRNGKILKDIIKENNLTPVNLTADYGIWTRENRQNTTEKSVIDYIMATPLISQRIQTVIVDEKGHLRVKGKNETDHNTLLMLIKINDMRKATYKETWKLDNTEGWKLYNKEMEKMENREKILGDRYETAETTIKKILKNTVGVRKVRTDKTKTTTNSEIKQAKEKKKTARKKFQQACKNGSSEEKQKTKIQYIT